MKALIGTAAIAIILVAGVANAQTTLAVASGAGDVAQNLLILATSAIVGISAARYTKRKTE